jgi:hypothetical protein
MDDHITYRDDFYGWSRRQAAVLRGMAARSDLPNDLDLEHVAEEIEDVGNEQRNAVQSHIRLIFVHMLKVASVERQELRAGWYAEIVNFHNEILGRSSNSMRQDIRCGAALAASFQASHGPAESRRGSPRPFRFGMPVRS